MLTRTSDGVDNLSIDSVTVIRMVYIEFAERKKNVSDAGKLTQRKRQSAYDRPGCSTTICTCTLCNDGRNNIIIGHRFHTPFG